MQVFIIYGLIVDLHYPNIRILKCKVLSISKKIGCANLMDQPVYLCILYPYWPYLYNYDKLYKKHGIPIPTYTISP